jgi:hypothetical protein
MLMSISDFNKATKARSQFESQLQENSLVKQVLFRIAALFAHNFKGTCSYRGGRECF